MKELCEKIDQNIVINPLNAKLNPIWHLLALLGAHHILHFSRIRVNNVTSCDLHIKKLWQLQCYLHNNIFIKSSNEQLEFKIWTVNTKAVSF